MQAFIQRLLLEMFMVMVVYAYLENYPFMKVSSVVRGTCSHCRKLSLTLCVHVLIDCVVLTYV